MSGNDVTDVFAISGAGLKAQDQRMKVIAENIANANTTPSSPGAKPYQRQVITFKNEFDKALGAYRVEVGGVRPDNSDFIKKYDPSHPAADKDGYVLTPNVNPLVEMMDMNEANRAYQANLNSIDAARGMVLNTIQLLQ
ncbi:MAG TPA: flagellar basal body rod protein FlgC [Alphaproteobacteria bacterium]|nr:flagellar basal body rod protein FlgC [Alphaproteobacteria bacterium]